MSYASREDDTFDEARDSEFYSPTDRFLRTEDMNDLRAVLLGQDETIEDGLSQIGIDPDDFDEQDIEDIKRRLNLIYDDEECCWVEED